MTTALAASQALTQALTQALRTLICEEIDKQGGWLSFARFMELALYAPGLGYYVNGSRKFGAAGDFVTAPEISPLFGRTLARSVCAVMRQSNCEVLEFGAGSGALAADVLNESAALGCPIERYRILDVSPDLRATQADTLKSRAPQWFSRVSWEESLPTSFSGVVLANEVLDAMPAHVVQWRDGAIDERGVALDGEGRFVWADRPAHGALLAAAQSISGQHVLPTPYVSEINLATLAWVRSLAALLTQGAALLIDYGFPAHELYHPQRAQGSLMCHTRHRAHPDPFDSVGLTDITTHVDFSAVSSAALADGLQPFGYTSQAQFLMNAGLVELLQGASQAQLPQLSQQVQRLTAPHEMGELFKVLALGRGVVDMLGFARGDRVHRL